MGRSGLAIVGATARDDSWRSAENYTRTGPSRVSAICSHGHKGLNQASNRAHSSSLQILNYLASTMLIPNVESTKEKRENERNERTAERMNE